MLQTFTYKVESDTRKLGDIMGMIKNVLSVVVDARDILFRHSLRSHVLSAWGDLEPAFERWETGRFASPIRLRQAGLTGSSLNLKYQGIFESYEKLNQQGGTSRVRQFLKWAKIIVGTLAMIVPYLKDLIEMLKEYMEGIDVALEAAESDT